MFDHSIDHNQANDLVLNAFRDTLMTAQPGATTEYDPDSKTISVKPVNVDHFRLDDGTTEALDYPEIPNVPVAFPRGGGWAITWPLEQGDPVLLVCCQRSIDEWYNSDGKSPVTPEDIRSHDISDAIAIPGLFPKNNNQGEANEKDLIISHKDGRVKLVLKPNGEIEITGTKFSFIGDRMNIGSTGASAALAKAQQTDSNFSDLVSGVNEVRTVLALPPILPPPTVASGKAYTND